MRAARIGRTRRRKRGERGAQPAEGGRGSGRRRRRGSSSGAVRTTAKGQAAPARQRERRATDGLLPSAHEPHTHSGGARRARVCLAAPRHLTTGQHTHFTARAGQSPWRFETRECKSPCNRDNAPPHHRTPDTLQSPRASEPIVIREPRGQSPCNSMKYATPARASLKYTRIIEICACH